MVDHLNKLHCTWDPRRMVMKASTFQERKPECMFYVRGSMTVYDVLFFFLCSYNRHKLLSVPSYMYIVEGCFHWLDKS